MERVGCRLGRGLFEAGDGGVLRVFEKAVIGGVAEIGFVSVDIGEVF